MTKEKPKRRKSTPISLFKFLLIIILIIVLCFASYALFLSYGLAQLQQKHPSQVFSESRQIQSSVSCSSMTCTQTHLFWTNENFDKIQSHYLDVGEVSLILDNTVFGYHPSVEGYRTIINRNHSEDLYFARIGIDVETGDSTRVDVTREMIGNRTCLYSDDTYSTPDFDCEEVIVIQNSISAVEALLLAFDGLNLSRYDDGYFILHKVAFYNF
jgi:hypothetical protein